MLNFDGIIPPLTTPFNKKGALMLKKLQENIELLNQFELRGFLVLGSNGEFVSLTHKEKLKVMESARAIVPRNKILIAGTGCQSTRETIELTKEAGKIGVDAVLVLNPFYYKSLLTPEIIEEHFLRVADASPVPVLIYNMPANSGIDIDTDVIKRLSAHPNIAGMKDSGGNLTKMGEILKAASGDFRMISGSAGLIYPSLALGSTGTIAALANVAPARCIEIHNAFRSGAHTKARDLQLSIIQINKMVTSQWGIPALKYAMDHVGLFGGAPRKPLREIRAKVKDKLVYQLEAAGIKHFDKVNHNK